MRAEKPSRSRSFSKRLGNDLDHPAGRADPNLVLSRGTDDVDGPMDGAIVALQQRQDHRATTDSLQRNRLGPRLGDADSLHCSRCFYRYGLRLRDLTNDSGCEHQRTQQGRLRYKLYRERHFGLLGFDLKQTLFSYQSRGYSGLQRLVVRIISGRWKII